MGQSTCGVVANEMADYVAKNGMAISHIFSWNLLFHSVTLKIKRNIQAEISRYYATEGQHKTSSKVVHNKHNSRSSKRSSSGNLVTNQQPLTVKQLNHTDCQFICLHHVSCVETVIP